MLRMLPESAEYQYKLKSSAEILVSLVKMLRTRREILYVARVPARAPAPAPAAKAYCSLPDGRAVGEPNFLEYPMALPPFP